MNSAEGGIKVAVVGGGIAGLCLARGLIQHPHLSVNIYEATAQYLDIGGGLGFHRNAMDAMELIDPAIREAYLSAATPTTHMDLEMSTKIKLASGPYAGVVVGELGRAKGRHSITRHDLLEALQSLIPKERLHFHKRLIRIDDLAPNGVQLMFKDGSSAVADCLVGCDGVHSCTRKYILGNDHPATAPVDSGWSLTRRMLPMEEARTVLPSLCNEPFILCGPGGSINGMPLNKGRTFSISVLRKTCKENTAVQKPGDNVELERIPIEDYDSFTQEAKNMVKLVNHKPTLIWYPKEHRPAPYYYRGRVAMMGDAAHASTTFAGNGAAQAIEDGAVINALLGRVTRASDLEKAFEAYDAVRRERSQKVVEISRSFGAIYALEDPEAGDDVNRMRQKLKEGAAYTNNIDLKSQNDAALRLFEKLLEENNIARMVDSPMA